MHRWAFMLSIVCFLAAASFVGMRYGIDKEERLAPYADLLFLAAIVLGFVGCFLLLLRTIEAAGKRR